MKDYKERPEEIQHKVRNEEVNEINNRDSGLESVAEGCDFAEGDKVDSPNCGEV
jgi:LPS O-antigen subunit length determinant protein (WzzB/FepE family)